MFSVCHTFWIPYLLYMFSRLIFSICPLIVTCCNGKHFSCSLRCVSKSMLHLINITKNSWLLCWMMNFFIRHWSSYVKFVDVCYIYFCEKHFRHLCHIYVSVQEIPVGTFKFHCWESRWNEVPPSNQYVEQLHNFVWMILLGCKASCSH